MGVLNPNSTSYVHPNEPNLVRMENSMDYDAQGRPVIRTIINTSTVQITGPVNILSTVTVSSTPENPVHVHLTEVGTYGLLADFVPVKGIVTATQGTTPWVITGTVALDQTTLNSLEYITVQNNVTATITGTVSVSNFPTSLTITNTSFAITNFPTTSTVYQGTNPWTITGTVNIGTLPEVEIKNNTGNPIPISANTATNSSDNPVYVSANISNSGPITVAQADVAVTAFDEPLSVTITPVIQASVVYGLDPDFWSTTKLRGGSIVTTTGSVWQVASGTSPGGYARLATNQYMTYQPGQGSIFRWTAAYTNSVNTVNTGTKHAYGVDSIVQNAGPVDREDGYSFGYSGQTGVDPVTGADRRKIGILHRRGGLAETRALTVTVAPTGVQTATIVINSITYTVALTASTSPAYTAEQISRAIKAQDSPNNLWDIEACGGIITFTYYTSGPQSGTYSFSSAGAGTLAVASFSQYVAGVTPTDTWTYVDDWDNKSINFDPSKLNVFGVDLRWLGAGRVRFFMEDPGTGKMVLIHTQRWASQYLVPHIAKPSLRIIYRSGTTNTAVTPSQNVVVYGASAFAGIQGNIIQTGASQGWYNIDSTSRAKDTVWHLMSIQNPYVRNNSINKSSIIIQSLTVAAQANDPSVVYVVKNSTGTNDLIVFNPIPNSTVSMFAQQSTSLLSENLAVDRITNIQTLGINASAEFDLIPYNLMLSPGDIVSVFINSSNAINRTSVGMTWRVD